MNNSATTNTATQDIGVEQIRFSYDSEFDALSTANGLFFSLGNCAKYTRSYSCIEEGSSPYIFRVKQRRGLHLTSCHIIDVIENVRVSNKQNIMICFVYVILRSGISMNNIDISLTHWTYWYCIFIASDTQYRKQENLYCNL